ncbi:lytic transglycosylase domain-containing protein [Sphingomonas morindae]|uniref:Transglycosylase SLT domain-containing protein n=1 Tax=Sphingomonas morindae TaxID=1541170 RepID=A0ABY4XDT2_9SPHN|nr:transglycosylase SLT domain-containing protein [Sphingomonas morindae]USI75122.1 transglycosylase SLT domain-containing protein [Sphingomonas morindae]
MRPIYLASAALLTLGCGATAEAAAKQHGHRKVEVIVMGATGRASSKDGLAAEVVTGAKPASPPDLAPMPAAFRTHDLSRQWVAFQMANSFSSSTIGRGGEVSTPPTAAPAGVVPASPAVAIPRWMTEGASFASAPTSFSPGCAAANYRPSGFLDQRTEYRRLGYYGIMSSIACEYGIPVSLFDAMIIRESGYNADIYSAKNAFGLTQLMSSTAAGMGVDRYDVEQNLRGGARYLRQQLDRFGAVHLALAAYNAGPGRVKAGVIPRIAETQDYVDNVLTNWQRLAGLPRGATVQGVSAGAIATSRAIGRVATVSSY